MIWGARISLSVGVISVLVGGAVGIVLGLISGFFGGWLDSLIMRFCDVLFAFPGLLLAIGVVAVLGPGISNVIWATAVFSVPAFARLVRGDTLALKRAVYVQAARSIGVRPAMLMLRHILPGALPGVIVNGSLRLGNNILTAASLELSRSRRTAAEPGMGRDAGGRTQLSRGRGLADSGSQGSRSSSRCWPSTCLVMACGTR